MWLCRPFQVSFFFALLASGAVIMLYTVDSHNPEASNPIQPPTKLNRPAPAENPFKAGFETVPSVCTNMQKLSQQCIRDLQAQPGGVIAFGGELK
jgi:hypothetical protein